MFITRKRYEKELAEARKSGYNEALERRYEEDRIREIHERIDRLADMINQPKTVPGFRNEVQPNA